MDSTKAIEGPISLKIEYYKDFYENLECSGNWYTGPH